MAMSLTRRATVCAVAVAALVSSVAHAQCDPSSRVTLAASDTNGVTGYSGSKTIPSASASAIEKVCAVFVCPAGTARSELVSLALARSEAVPVSALNGVQTRVGNTGTWRVVQVPTQENSANKALISTSSAYLADNSDDEIQVELSVQSASVATEVSISTVCIPQEEKKTFSWVPYIIAAHVIPLIVLTIIIIILLLRRCNPKFRAAMAALGWHTQSDELATLRTIQNRAGGAMWYDHATEVVDDFNKEKIYETEERLENQEEQELNDVEDDQLALQSLL